jgi:hypothetical protein
MPRALFTGRTGREPRYDVAIEELQDQVNVCCGELLIFRGEQQLYSPPLRTRRSLKRAHRRGCPERARYFSQQFGAVRILYV